MSLNLSRKEKKFTYLLDRNSCFANDNNCSFKRKEISFAVCGVPVPLFFRVLFLLAEREVLVGMAEGGKTFSSLSTHHHTTHPTKILPVTSISQINSWPLATASYDRARESRKTQPTEEFSIYYPVLLYLEYPPLSLLSILFLLSI